MDRIGPTVVFQLRDYESDTHHMVVTSTAEGCNHFIGQEQEHIKTDVLLLIYYFYLRLSPHYTVSQKTTLMLHTLFTDNYTKTATNISLTLPISIVPWRFDNS